MEQIWAQHALELTRQKLMTHQHDEWLEQHDESARETSRHMGRNLMALIVKFMTGAEDDDEMVAEARRVGQQYGNEARRIGLAITDALQASMFFRDTLIASAVQLPDNVRIPRETQVFMLDRINAIMNMIQLGIADPYSNNSDA